MSFTSALRISKELAEIQKNPDSGIYVSINPENITTVRALVVGPPDTPYEYGFFEFLMVFGNDYPTKAPKVTALTTNHGRTRFNPNIYAGGKVCLSILGTWRGEAGEQWSSAQGIESVLLSIQSLMSSHPFENEPGYELQSTQNQSSDYKLEREQYSLKIRHETLRISVLQRLERYLNISATNGLLLPRNSSSDDRRDGEDRLQQEPFEDWCKRLFRYYYPSYMRSIAKDRELVTEGQPFTSMPFEFSGNIMLGKFSYKDIERRMKVVLAALDTETEGWAEQGLALKNDERGIAPTLLSQFKQISAEFSSKYEGTIMLEMVEDNPFCWRMIYIGRPMTHLDGGLFRIRLNISPRFPEEQPRAVFETPIYHVNVSAEGVPFYRPLRSEDLKSHLEALIKVLEVEQLSPDPRTWMNPGAAELYFGKPEEKREYRKLFRRSVLRSSEY